MGRAYVALLHEYLEEMEDLSDAEFGRLCRSLLAYSMTGTAPALSGNERFYFKRVKMQEDRFQASYDEAIEKRREAGRKGAEAKLSKAKQCQAMPSKAKQCQAMPSNNKTKIIQNTSPIGEDSARARKPDVPEGMFSAKLEGAVNEWLAYKREKRQAYKPTGLQHLLTEIQHNAETYGDDAVIDLIDTCMSSNYQGILWDRLRAETRGQTKIADAGEKKRVAARAKENASWMRKVLADEEAETG